MRGILIDPAKRVVEPVEIGDGLQPIYKAIGANVFTVIYLDGDALFLDDEGLFRDSQDYFALGNYPHPLAGRGLILGCTEDGESVDARLTVEKVLAGVRWLEPRFAIAMHDLVTAGMHTRAAIGNAKDKGQERGFNHMVHSPTMFIDEKTGKAKGKR